MTAVGTTPDHAVRGSRRWWALASLTGANLLVFAAVTIMNVALPAARSDLALSTGATQLVVTLYSLAFGTFILFAGRLADVVGLRRCLVAGLVGFAGASLIGGMAPDGGILLLARALQGGSGAFVAATAVSLMSVSFPYGRDREIAFGVLGVVMGIGTAGSFLLAGALVDVLSWRWCLLVNVPLALAVAGVILRTAPAGPRREGSRVDVVGAVLVCLSLAALVAGLDRVTAWGWRHGGTLGLLAGGLFGLGLFVAALRRVEQPLVPLHLVADRNRVAAYVAAAFVGVAMFAGMFVLTSFLQEVRGLSPVQIGLAFLPLAVGAVLTTWLLPALRARASAALVLALGLVLAAAAVATFTVLGPESSYGGGVLPAMLLLGAGGTVVMITAGDVATLGAGAESGVAGSAVNSAQQVGAALGTALLTSVMSLTTRDELAAGADAATATIAGYARAGLVGALLLVVAAVLVWLLPRRQ
ncbi:MFS transporter [Nocardioides antri]|uniref:MFS transporter n=1 Tax=Nocardioides antri TaxID=2607659 RepID=A0A5B1M4P0_9ACTN|nr:MFS transporter [Nocardioides antri]KAA1427636.1 MFS transporter [Nocardioides antri]